MTSLKCCLCQTKTEDSLNLGEFKKTGKYTAHYYCLLLASDIKQSGRDNHGILGFLASDIMKQVKISEKRVCKYCRKKGATIICNTKHCRKYFHLPCGLKNGTSHQFYGQFKSRCAKHKYRQPYKKPSEDVSCLICCELIHFHWKQMHQVLWAPCCQKNGFFHRACIQQMALSAGLYFFKCPFCNNQDKFQKAMQHNGVFIPERDASWELVPGAFDDLMFRHNECNAKDCLAPRGRKFEGSGGWLMVLCSMCGSQGTHVTCSQLKKKLDWICTQCTTVTSTNPTTSTTNSTSSNTNTPAFTTNHSSSTTNNSISTINPSSSTKNPSTSRSSSSTDYSPLNSTNLPSNSENPPPEPTIVRPTRRSPRKSSTQSQKPPRSTNTPPTPLESSENPPPTRNSVVKIIETIIDACKITGADPTDPALQEPRRCTRQSTSTIINNNIPAGSGPEINSKCTKSSATTSCHSETNRKRRKTIDKDYVDTNLQDITIKPIAPPKDTDKSVREQLNQSETIADTSIRLYSPQQSTDVLNIINNPERKQNSTLNNNGQSRPVDIRQETTIISPFHCSNPSCDCFTVKPATSARSKPNLKRARAISRQCIENSREIKLNSRRELRNTTTVCNNTQFNSNTTNNKSISSCNTLFANIPAAEQSYNLYESTYDCTTNTFNIIPIPNKNINTVPVEYYEQDSNGQFIRTQEPIPCTQINDVRVQSLSISATASNSTLNKQTRINIVHVHQHSSEKQINKTSLNSKQIK